MARHHARWFPRFAGCYRPRTAGAIRDGLAIAADDTAQIRAGRANVRARIHEAMDASGWTPGCAGRGRPRTRGTGIDWDPSMQLPWTHAGLPVVTLPWGTAANGLPLGLQLVARFMDDERLLALAAQLEGSRPSVELVARRSDSMCSKGRLTSACSCRRFAPQLMLSVRYAGRA